MPARRQRGTTSDPGLINRRCEPEIRRAAEQLAAAELPWGRSRSPFDIRPIAGHIGAEIHGVDLREPLAPAVLAEVRATLLRWKVIFFRDQDLTLEEHGLFAARESVTAKVIGFEMSGGNGQHVSFEHARRKALPGVGRVVGRTRTAVHPDRSLGRLP